MEPELLAKIEAHNAEAIRLKRKYAITCLITGCTLSFLGVFLILKPCSWQWFIQPNYLNHIQHKLPIFIISIGIALITAGFQFIKATKGSQRA